MAKIISSILDHYYDKPHSCYTVVVEYDEDMVRKGWTSISYASRELALRECVVGVRIKEGF